ncbi:hypothetical protein BU25DRAFT_35778 [Macroventuria anomochaeta]|uniref:Uncharacterized protein n=1 Tax=Macroventuria anomochaeta TaxID=301207 RepID=A0ACB6S5M8_9PLEO|nr:uncharacterized protein BU25DRAFT_35778 [Macroventuria anomochaeta]KAF2628432.1 hypothetical protein BU25DRAFT_35778 [Macroventuria anomochaeta]
MTTVSMASSDDEEVLQLTIELSMQRSPSASSTLNAVSDRTLGDEVAQQTSIVHCGCSVCQPLSTDGLSVTLEDLKGQQHKCELCTLLWDGIRLLLILTSETP